MRHQKILTAVSVLTLLVLCAPAFATTVQVNPVVNPMGVSTLGGTLWAVGPGLVTNDITGSSAVDNYVDEITGSGAPAVLNATNGTYKSELKGVRYSLVNGNLSDPNTIVTGERFNLNFDVGFPVPSGHSFGAVWNYQNEDNHYRFSWGSIDVGGLIHEVGTASPLAAGDDQPGFSVWQRVNGVDTLLGFDANGWLPIPLSGILTNGVNVVIDRPSFSADTTITVTQLGGGTSFNGSANSFSVTTSGSSTVLNQAGHIGFHASANSGNIHIGNAQFVPEPGSFILAAFGLVGMVGWGIRRRNKK